jgi:transcriptional regulator with XRE-family HTH domain
MKILLGELMYKQNLSIRQVAFLTGLSSATIQKVMKEDSNPTMRTLEQISKGLKIPFEDLYELDE